MINSDAQVQLLALLGIRPWVLRRPLHADPDPAITALRRAIEAFMHHAKLPADALDQVDLAVLLENPLQKKQVLLQLLHVAH